MQVLSTAEMQECDRATTGRFGVPSIDLMRAAASAVADFARRVYPRARRVTVLCGHGNNGGDGMMVARLLAEARCDVTTLLLGAVEDLKGDAATAWLELVNPAHSVAHVITSAEDLARRSRVLQTDLIVDAILGTGFVPPLRGLPLAVLEWLNAAQASPRVPILAVDLPSGWSADSTASASSEPVFPADAVVTFTAPKPAHVFSTLTRHWAQPVVAAPIGSPDSAIVSSQKISWAGSSLDLVQSPRSADAHKGNFGHVLVVGGSMGRAGGKAGAPAMTALAALRSGAGLVTAAVPAPASPLVAAVAPELMTWPLAANSSGSISSQNLAPAFLAELMAQKTVLAIGPGMGQEADTVPFLTGILSASRVPAVIDADALNILAANPSLIAHLARERVLVLTPHPGEMARLAGTSTAEVQGNRLQVAREYAQRMGVTLVLKGARTLIAHPDGLVAVNTTGNPGMAKGGSGDTLTGLIAGLLAQHPSHAARAIEAAVYLHGLAADFAVRAADVHTILATDTLVHLPRAFRFRAKGPGGYLWLQGLPEDLPPALCSREAPE